MHNAQCTMHNAKNDADYSKTRERETSSRWTDGKAIQFLKMAKFGRRAGRFGGIND